MATTKSPVEFFRQVRQEVAKVTWPTRKETTLTTVMVFAMVAVTSIFFLLVDSVLSTAVTKLLGFGG
jgi:preprotein translocase subunit SecE